MTLYIDPQGNRYKISPEQSDLIKEDWVGFQKKEDGTKHDGSHMGNHSGHQSQIR